MNNTDKEYFRLLNTILEKGTVKKNRTGINTVGVFGEQAKFPVSFEEFPILTTKKVWFKGVVHELLWFIRGDTNIKYLVDNDVHIWNSWPYKRYAEKFPTLTGIFKWDGDEHGRALSMDKFLERIKNDEKFAAEHGELGEGTYGGMWRAFPYFYENCVEQGLKGEVDQLQKVLDKLKTNPDDRRMIVSAWHPYWVEKCALPPCHCLFQFHTEELTHDERFELSFKNPTYKQKEGSWGQVGYHTIQEQEEALNRMGVPSRRLNLLLYQRSCDTFLGVPFNITSYSLLLAMVAHCVNMQPGTFIHTYGDLHIYENHKEQVNEQLSREPKPLPRLWLNPDKRDLFDFKYEDIRLEGYDPHPAIKGEVAV